MAATPGTKPAANPAIANPPQNPKARAMSEFDDLCPRPERLRAGPTEPLSPPIYLSSVYRCEGPEQAGAILSGETQGYAYSRDGQPNADLLAEKCRSLHAAEAAAVTSSGMAALALAILSQLQSGDHLIASSHLYGRSLSLLNSEAQRFGILCSVVDTFDLDATARAFNPRTRMVVVETITNPLLRVSDLTALVELSHRHGARLLVDNTLAGPIVCRPMELGADFVLESLTKSMNGHSDVVLGLLCGRSQLWQRVPAVLSTWGLASAPFDCWLALRGLGTLALRMERATAGALDAARFLARAQQAGSPIAAVHYPGLENHPDHALSRRQLGGRFGSLVTFTLTGELDAAKAFISAARQIPFCPSLGELSTTLSHPQSTSHRGLAEEQRRALGIFGGTIRLSLGVESREFIENAIAQGLAAVR